MRKLILPSAIVLVCGTVPTFPMDDAPGSEPVAVLSPRDGARIPSAFVALTAAAAAGACFAIARDEQRIGDACADLGGHFDIVIRAPQGNHVILISRKEDPTVTLRAIHVSINPAGGSPRTAGPWDLLREGDVILSSSAGSIQTALYDPRYTHAALYVGPGPDGAALIAEAVSEESAGGLGEVRAVPIEQTLEWREAQSIDIFRLKGGLSPPDREAVLAFARAVVNRGLKFWTAGEEFAALYAVWLQWDQHRDRPVNAARFQQALDRLQTHKFSLERFNCATFIWRAYREGSHARIDLGDPNRMKFGGRLARAFTPAFLDRVRPYFLGPDSLYRSGRLEQVAAPE